MFVQFLLYIAYHYYKSTGVKSPSFINRNVIYPSVLVHNYRRKQMEIILLHCRRYEVYFCSINYYLNVKWKRKKCRIVKRLWKYEYNFFFHQYIGAFRVPTNKNYYSNVHRVTCYIFVIFYNEILSLYFWFR